MVQLQVQLYSKTLLNYTCSIPQMVQLQAAKKRFCHNISLMFQSHKWYNYKIEVAEVSAVVNLGFNPTNGTITRELIEAIRQYDEMFQSH